MEKQTDVLRKLLIRRIQELIDEGHDYMTDEKALSILNNDQLKRFIRTLEQ